jgi:hypothetical protein
VEEKRHPYRFIARRTLAISEIRESKNGLAKSRSNKGEAQCLALEWD